MNNKNSTNIVIGILLVGFTIYMYSAKPNQFFDKKNHDIEITKIKNANALNLKLNEKARTKITNQAVKSTENGIFRQVEQMPRYKSCEYLDEINAQICTNRQIQNYVSKLEISEDVVIKKQTKLFFSFVIDEYGYVQNIKLLKGQNKALIKIAEKHLKKMPKFAKAGSHNNKAVKVKYNIPFIIEINK